MELCTNCGIEKQLDQFYPTKKFKTGQQTICKPCYTKTCSVCGIDKSLENYFKYNHSSDKHHSICKNCWSARYDIKILCKCGKLVGKKYMNKHLQLKYHTLIPNKEI